MPDERAESISQGIAPPPESEKGRQAEARNREQLIRTPPEAQPDGAMGGTSDVDSPADEAELGRALRERTDRQRPGG